jgi:iron complex outermembrane receptor protein
VNANYVFARTSIGEITGFVNLNRQDKWYETAAWPAVMNGDPVVYPFQEMVERTVVDARLSLEQVEVGDGTMRFTLWGKNLTDEDYSTFSINFGSSLGLITENYGDPRTFGVEVAYEY